MNWQDNYGEGVWGLPYRAYDQPSTIISRSSGENYLRFTIQSSNLFWNPPPYDNSEFSSHWHLSPPVKYKRLRLWFWLVNRIPSSTWRYWKLQHYCENIQEGPNRMRKKQVYWYHTLPSTDLSSIDMIFASWFETLECAVTCWWSVEILAFGCLHTSSFAFKWH